MRIDMYHTVRTRYSCISRQPQHNAMSFFCVLVVDITPLHQRDVRLQIGSTRRQPGGVRCLLPVCACAVRSAARHELDMECDAPLAALRVARDMTAPSGAGCPERSVAWHNTAYHVSSPQRGAASARAEHVSTHARRDRRAPPRRLSIA